MKECNSPIGRGGKTNIGKADDDPAAYVLLEFYGFISYNKSSIHFEFTFIEFIFVGGVRSSSVGFFCM